MKQLKRLRKTIKKIKEKTGWSTLKVLKRLGRAYKYGITPTDYLKNNCYKKKRKDLEKLGKKLQKRNLAIKETMINRKMTKKEATKLVKEAHDLGFTYSRYLNNKVWEFNSDELPEAKEALDKIKKRDIYYREYYEKVAAKKTGWKVEKVKEEMAKARKKGHYSLSYIRYSLYLLKDEEIANKKLEENKLTEEEIKIKEEHERERKEHIAEIMKEKNWTLGRYRIEFLKAKYNCGCSATEFYSYKLYNKTLKEQKTYITFGLLWPVLVNYCDFEDEYRYFDDKSLFNEKFKKFVKRRWFTTDDLTYEKFEENIKGLKLIAYKPIDKLQGIGFKKFKVNESKLQNANVYEYIISHGRGIVEEFITQHPTTAAFNSKSCNSMRIVTMNLNNEFKILGGVFRVGIDNEFDNWSAGGIIAGLDIKTGKINTDGSDKNGHKFIVHPNSKIKFKGYQIPCWKKVVKALEEASKMLPKMPYIGWDVVITDQEEVEFIEGNHNHDITILQAPYGILENKGVKYLIEPYITEGVEMKD